MARQRRLNRRDFLRATAAGGGLILASSGLGALLQACGAPAAPQPAPTAAGGAAGGAAKVIKLGLNVPLSGAAAAWGINMKWVAEESARRVNQAGGVTVAGQKYEFQVITYDNKYTSAGGTEVTQKLVNEDKVSYIIGTVGSAPTLAMQAITEPMKMLVFETAWAPDSHDTSKPYSFQQLQEPLGTYRVFFPWLAKQHPQIKSVAMLDPNDATGTAGAKVAADLAPKVGWNVQRQDFYERGATEFAPIATKLAAGKPDMISLGTTPPGDAALIFKALKELGWDGIKASPGSTSVGGLMQAAGPDVAEGIYITLAPDFSGPQATPLQQELAAAGQKATGNNIDGIAMSAYDALQALVKAIQVSGSLDSTVLRDTLPKIIFDSTYGPISFGYAADFGRPSVMLLPIIVTQIQKGKPVDVARSWPQELKDRLKAAGMTAPE